MHQNDASTRLADYSWQVRIKTKPADVVHDLSTRLERAPRDTGPIRVDRYRDLYSTRPALRLPGITRRVSSSSDTGSLPRPRRFAANIDDVGAFLFDLFPARDRLVAIEILAAIGKRIWRDVEDTHDSRSFAEWYRSARQIPDVFLSHLSFNSRSCSTEPNK